MIRSDLRLELKSLLDESVGTNDYWSEAQLNRYLNMGLAFVESRILMIDPMAFIYRDSFALTANEDLYALPVGCITVLRLNSPKRLRVMQESVIARENENGATGRLPTRYGRLGRYVRLGPKPTETIAGQMAITYVPTLTMAADSDTPGIHDNLEWLILLRASIIAISGTAEKEKLAQNRNQLREGLDEISTYYRPQADSATYMRPDYDIIDGDDPRGFDAFALPNDSIRG